MKIEIGDKYSYKGNVYSIVSIGKIKTDKGWERSVNYKDASGEPYTREYNDFEGKFTFVSHSEEHRYNRSELNEFALSYISNAGFSSGTNITIHALKCFMVDFVLDVVYPSLPVNTGAKEEVHLQNLLCDIHQLLTGWKGTCAKEEWSIWDEQILLRVAAFQQKIFIPSERKEEKIDVAIKEFSKLKEKAPNLRDSVYLDGVLAVLEGIKNKGAVKSEQEKEKAVQIDEVLKGLSKEEIAEWLNKNHIQPITHKKECNNKVNGSCQLHNVHCSYPKCEE